MSGAPFAFRGVLQRGDVLTERCCGFPVEPSLDREPLSAGPLVAAYDKAGRGSRTGWIVSGERHHREWSDEHKLWFAAETYEPGASISNFVAALDPTQLGRLRAAHSGSLLGRGTHRNALTLHASLGKSRVSLVWHGAAPARSSRPRCGRFRFDERLRTLVKRTSPAAAALSRSPNTPLNRPPKD